MSATATSRALPVDEAAGAGLAGARLLKVLAAIGRSGLLLGAVTAVAVTVWVLVGLGGLQYYATPVEVRAYAPAHRLLRPAGPVGQLLGVAGAGLMLVPFVYAARKRFRFMRPVGSHAAWLEVHLFCGIVGPVLVTLHTSFKFNGIVSAAYWAMVLVMVSGFVGRFLYLRIPRSLRGVELTRMELEARADDLRAALAAAARTESLQRLLLAFHQAAQPGRRTIADLLVGELALGRRVRALEQTLVAAGLPDALREATLGLAVERALLARRAAHLERTKTLFGAWHVFHMPLVWLMLAIVSAHVGVAVYLGYVPFHW
jgi:hypothetical protein